MTLEFTVDGGYDLDLTAYTFTNLNQLDKYNGVGNAPDGYTLGTFQIATDIGVTVS